MRNLCLSGTILRSFQIGYCRAQTRALAQTRSEPLSSSAIKDSSAKIYEFQNKSEENKFDFVHKVFSNVASKYDIMNDVMSLGVHRLWKSHFIKKLDPYPGTKLLDVAGGTGDIAFEFLEYTKSRNDLTSSVVVCDINQAMMNVGMERSVQRRLNDPNRLSWIHGDGLNLPFEDSSFDAYSVVFGIRNMVNLPKALQEAHRVLKPGGIFQCMEFSQVHAPVIKNIYDFYSFQIIPVAGEVISQDWKSYQYLVESIRKFPDQETFKTMIQDAGFKLVDYENLSFGIAAIHTGYKSL